MSWKRSLRPIRSRNCRTRTLERLEDRRNMANADPILTASGLATYVEDQPAALVAPSASITDDNLTFSGAQLKATVGSGSSAYDRLDLRPASGVTIEGNEISYQGNVVAKAEGTLFPLGDMHVYKTVAGRDLHAYVVQPADAALGQSRSAVVIFHGGGWVLGGPYDFNEQARYFASRGMTAILIEYRLLEAGTITAPEVCAMDAKSAMRWVRSHAEEFGINPNKIAAGGASAGAQLSAFAGMVPGLNDPQDDLSVSPRPDALLLWNPVINNGPGGWGYSRTRDRFREFSPAHNVSSDDPPAIEFLGTSDALIPVSIVTDFAASMRSAGVRCDVHLYDGQPHGFYIYAQADNHDFYSTLYQADRFLNSLGFLAGEPTITTPSPNFPPQDALTVTFNSAATQPAVNAVLKSLSFFVQSDQPTSLVRAVDLVFSDGLGGTSETRAVGMAVVPNNDPPILTILSVESSYRLKDAPIKLMPNLVVNDPDTTLFSYAKSTISVAGGGTVDDRLTIVSEGNAPGKINAADGSVFLGGVKIATYRGGSGSTPLSIVFAAGIHRDAVQTVLRNVAYATAKVSTTNLQRTISFETTDGSGGRSTIANTRVVINPNAAPVITLGGTLNYRRGSASVAIAGGATLIDDSPAFTYGKFTATIASGASAFNAIEIGGPFVVTGNDVRYNGVSIGTLAGNGQGQTALDVRFKTTATPAIAQLLVRSLRFRASAGAPLGDRLIRFQVTDGSGGISNIAEKTVRVTS